MEYFARMQHKSAKLKHYSTLSIIELVITRNDAEDNIYMTYSQFEDLKQLILRSMIKE